MMHISRLIQKLAIVASICAVSLPPTNVGAQEKPMELFEQFLLKSVWQEYMPDAYALDDSTLLLAGLSVNMADSTMNFFIRIMTTGGTILLEKEFLNFDNPYRSSYLLSSYYMGSAIDSTHVYIASSTKSDFCSIEGEMVRAVRIVKVRLDGLIEYDTVYCVDNIIWYEDMSTSSEEDSIYLYGGFGYQNVDPEIVLTTIPKNFEVILHDTLAVSVQTHMIALGEPGNSRAIAGSHYRFSHFDNDWLKDIWYGEVEGDSIREDGRMQYFAGNVLRKAFWFDNDEMALLGFSQGALYDETSIYMIRADTLAWNFHDAFKQELSDIIRIGSGYCIAQASYRHDDDRKDKVIFHYLDHEGFPFAKEEHVTPWIWFFLTGLRIGEYYFAFVQIRDQDVFQQVTNGELPLVEANREYTHVLKFKLK